MGLNETLERLKDIAEKGISNEVKTEEETPVCNIPQLDEWELNLTVAAIRQYMKLNLQPFKDDTLRQKKRKKFNKQKLSDAIGKIRAAQKPEKNEK